MGNRRFDDLTRSQSIRTVMPSRRSVARMLATVSLVGALGSQIRLEDAGAKKKRNKSKKTRKKCKGGTTKCGSQCKHVQSDAANCGGCGHACQSGETCADGRCIPDGCPDGEKDCHGTCIPAGDCCADGDCDGGETCRNGTCSCANGASACGGACVDTNTDPNHCGGCGVRCLSGICADSQCTETGAEFRVTVEGFKVHNPTWDDPLQLDGAGDEVFVQVGWLEVDGDGNELAPFQSYRSSTIGDDFRQADRIQGGTASDLGGFRKGDAYPPGFDITQPWVRAGTLDQEIPGMIDLPWLVGDIKLRHGQGSVAMAPTIWEFDGGTSFLQTWLESLSNNGGAIARAVWEFLKLPGSSVIADGVAGLDNFILDAVGRGGDRPIGLIDLGGGRYDFKPSMLVLDYERAKHAVDRRHGVVEFRFRDVRPDGAASPLAGDYTLYLKVEELQSLLD